MKSLTARDTTEEQRPEFAQRFLDVGSLEMRDRLESHKARLAKSLASTTASLADHVAYEDLRYDPRSGARQAAIGHATLLRKAFEDRTELFPATVTAFQSTKPGSEDVELLCKAVIAILGGGEDI